MANGFQIEFALRHLWMTLIWWMLGLFSLNGKKVLLVPFPKVSFSKTWKWRTGLISKKFWKKKLKKLTDVYQTFFTTFISTFFLNPFFAKTTRLVKTSFRDCARRCRDHCPAPFSHFVWQKGYFLCSQCSWVLCPPSFKSVPL